MSSVSDIALKGIQSATDSLVKHAENISTSPESIDDLVGLTTDSLQIKADTKVIKVDQDLQKSVLDIIA